MPGNSAPSRFSYLTARLALSGRLLGVRLGRVGQVLSKPWRLAVVPELIFALLDFVAFFDLYEALTNALLPAPRPLTPAEYQLLVPIFGSSIPYDLIRIDERAYVGPSWSHFCYVSFHTINSWGPMSPPTLVHEAVHVWQYTRRGAVYIPRALYAQTTPEGYNYGGLAPLRAKRELEDFNYEQQADIIEDFFRLANGYEAQWVRGRGAEVLPYYYPYVNELTTPA